MKKIAYCDLEQAESRTVGAIIYRLFGDETYLLVQESGDPHTLVCSMVWRNLPWPADFTLAKLLASSDKKFPKDLLAAARSIANAQAYQGMSYRDLGKRLAHGTNYVGQPPQMARATHTTVSTVRSFQSAYFDVFPFIKEWQEWVRTTIQQKRTLTTMLGRRRVFFDRPEEQATINKAVAFEPQSVATGDYMNRGWLSLWEKNFPIRIHKQVHDALAFSYDAGIEQEIIPEVCKILSWPITLTAHKEHLADLEAQRQLCRTDRETLARLRSLPNRVFSIPVEAKIGWNLGRYDPNTNPNGLIKFSATPDFRKRQQSLPVTFADHFLK